MVFFLRLRFNLLLVCRNAVDFYLLILNPAALLNSRVTCVYTTSSSLKNNSFFFIILVLLLPFLAVKCRNRGADSGHLWPVLLFWLRHTACRIFSSPTRDCTRALSSESMESWLLDRQGISRRLACSWFERDIFTRKGSSLWWLVMTGWFKSSVLFYLFS